MIFLNYRTIIFDCDGVLLNSNKIKTNAFYNSIYPYDEIGAQKLVEYHKAHGGISRYAKFKYYLEHINIHPVTKPSIDILLDSYASEVYNNLLTCDVASDLSKLRTISNARWFIVSGGDQEELKDIFYQRNLSHFFDGGIYGSPSTKNEIVSNLLHTGKIEFPACFLGDSRYDYEVASEADLDFLFVSDWTEFQEWKSFCKKNAIRCINKISDLLI